MAQIKLTDAEAAELKAFYQKELDKLSERVAEVKSLMARLSGSDAPAAKRGPKSKKATADKPAAKATGAKKGRKPRKTGPWPEFIVKTLTANGSTMTLKELLPIVQAEFKGDAAKTENNLRGHLVRMAKRNEIKSKKIKGSRELMYSAK
jgi:hypothetical protein